MVGSCAHLVLRSIANGFAITTNSGAHDFSIMGGAYLVE